MQLEQRSTPTHPAYRKLQHAFFAACLILGPFFTILEVVFNPSRSTAGTTGSAVIAANITANAGTNLWHLLFGMLALFLFPFGTLGMTMLAMRRSPWLATIGGFLALTGLFAFIVFAGQEELSYLMDYAARSERRASLLTTMGRLGDQADAGGVHLPTTLRSDWVPTHTY